MNKIKTLMTVLCAALLVMGMVSSASALRHYSHDHSNGTLDYQPIVP